MHRPLRSHFAGLFAAVGVAAGAGAASAEYQLTILHMNDQHSRIEPVSKYDGTCSAEDDAEGKCFGGVARVKTFLDGRRAALAGQNVITLNGGDEFQGSLFYTTYKGAAAAEFANRLGIDAMVVGNHEFDDGPEVLSAFIDKVEFPVISGNTSVYYEPTLKDKLPGYVILEVGGQKIGVIGLTATDTDELSSPGPNVAFSDEIRYLQTIVPEVEAQGANIVIALTHVGLSRDIEVAAASTGVDVIVGGHSHTYLSASDPKRDGAYPTWVTNADGQLVPIVQAGANSKYVGELTVTFSDAGEVLFAEGDTHLLDASIEKDAAVDARVKELAAPIEELKNKVVAEATAPIDGDRGSCRARECEMGVLVAEAMLDKVAEQGVSIAIANGGGLRASIDGGPVTMGEVLTVLPFQNTLATFKLKGADVVAALENGVSQVEEGAGRFAQVAGLRYSFDAAQPAGSRITAVEVADGDGWAPIDLEATYGVVSNNYMRQGGDGYAVFAKQGMDAYDYGPGLEVVVADYLAANSPYQPALRGRIVAGAGFDAAAAPATAEAAPAAEPAAETAAATESSGAAESVAAKIYVVKQGDTLWKIAKSQLGDATLYTKIVEMNGLPSGASLKIGQELKLP